MEGGPEERVLVASLCGVSGERQGRQEGGLSVGGERDGKGGKGGFVFSFP